MEWMTKLIFLLIILISTKSHSQFIMGDYPFNHIDVLEYKIEIDLRESFEQKNENLDGVVNIKCKVDTIAIEKVYLDAVELIIDSVFVNEEKVNYDLTDKYLIPHLQSLCHSGEILDIKIFFKRQSQNAPGYYFNHYTYNNIDEYIAYTASWQTNTRYWLPCKDWPTDKALVEMKVIVPKEIVAISNGKLINRIDELDYTEYIWKDTHPMATYVISISAARYVSKEMNIPRFSDPSDSIKISYYTFQETFEQMEKALEIVPELIKYYSSRFVEFPFDYLNFVAPGTRFGGMSNQTLIQFSNVPKVDSTYQFFVIPHELAHQWFGSYVNSANWSLWLTEGLAEYARILYNTRNSIIEYREKIISIAEQQLPFDSLSISDGSYGRLPVILEMLRTTLGDQHYWESFKNFQTTSAYGSTTIRKFNDAVNQTTGEIYNWFFDEWFYNGGHPKYKISWQIEKVFNSFFTHVRIEQTQTRQEVFTMPADITIVTQDGNTTSHVMNNERIQIFEIRTNSEPINVIFDKDTLIYLKELTYESVNFTPKYSYALEQNYPNPFNTTTKIEYRVAQSGFVTLTLYDILGNKVSELVNEEKHPGIYGLEIDGRNLASGIYIYRIITNNFVETKKMILLK